MMFAAHDAGRADLDNVRSEAILAHLDKVLASAVFAGTRRLKLVLRYLVQQTLNGSSAGLNEYRIGLEAFDKGESFDPGTDPIVRVEMSRLRTRLERYYDECIVDDGISFELPKGTYALSIRDAGGAALSSWRDSPTITIGVSLLQPPPSTRDTDTLCVQLTKELVEILDNEPYFSAIAQAHRFQPRSYRRFGAETTDRPDVDFIVDGRLQLWSPLVYATMRLIDVKRGGVYVLGHYVYEIKKAFTQRMDLPSAIMADIRSRLLTSRSGAGPEIRALGDGSRRDQPAESGTMADAIVDAAIETFAEDGYFGATVGSIALRAQVADRSVVDLFGNKIMLFIESVRTAAGRSLDVPHLESRLTIGPLKNKALQRSLPAAIGRWYSTLAIDRARFSIYSGLTGHLEYQHLIDEPIERIMRRLTNGSLGSLKRGDSEIDVRAAVQALVVFLIYFRVAPWSPEIKDKHDEVADTIVRQSLSCLFINASSLIVWSLSWLFFDVCSVIV